MTLMAVPNGAPDTVSLTLPTFRLEPGESLGHGLKRLSLGEIERAVTGFFDGEEAFPEAVHTARKSTKKLRALLRLIRSELGEKAYRYENRELRETARLLSEVRSAAVAVFALGEIQMLYGSVLADGALDEPLHRLAVRRGRIETRTMEDPEILPRLVSRLEKAHARYSMWPVGGEAREIYGMGIRDAFSAVGVGLKSTYGQGRMEMVKAFTTNNAGDFHLWRKRVKYLRHQLELLTPLWPEVIVGLAMTTARVGELLGEDHDLHELVSLLDTYPDLCPDPVERSLVKALASQRREDLETAARILGRRVYAENPVALVSRFETYWQTSQEIRETVGYSAIGR